MILDIYIHRFQQVGCEVESYTTGTEALATLKKGFTPDVILFDISMPEMNGYEFLGHVKQENLAPHAVLIALTNEADDEDIKKISELGVDAHYVKASLSPSEVIAKVESMLAARKTA